MAANNNNNITFAATLPNIGKKNSSQLEQLQLEHLNKFKFNMGDAMGNVHCAENKGKSLQLSKNELPNRALCLKDRINRTIFKPELLPICSNIAANMYTKVASCLANNTYRIEL
jgi:hypothetical protein